jgi:signal transduction histidine kinase
MGNTNQNITVRKKLNMGLSLPLLFLFIGSVLSLMFFEAAKTIVLPHLNLMESHIITILAISVLAVTTGYFILKKETLLKMKLEIENEELKKVGLEREIQSEIIQSITNSKDLNDLFHLIHNSLRKALYAENLFIALKDPDSGLFTFPYFVDKLDSAPAPVAMSKSCTSYIFRTGKSLIITPQVFKHLAELNEVELVGSHSPSWIGAPLRISSRIIGVLVLQHYERENIYSEEDRRFIDTIAYQIALVIERKQVEEELKKSFSLLSATLESTADGILVINAGGKVTNFNEKFIQLWRIPDSIVSTGDDDKLLAYVLNQLKDPDGFIRKVKELYQNDEDVSFDSLEFIDGRIFERYSQPQRFENKSVGRVWSFREVTEQKRNEENLVRLNLRLEELNATKDKFFSIIAHDLKNPFNSLVGLSSLLMSEYPILDESKKKKYIAMINETSGNTLKLLENLLEWARLQTNNLKYTPESINIKTLVLENIELLKPEADRKGIALKSELGEIVVDTDKNFINTILRNLITNAMKYTMAGGSVKIYGDVKSGKTGDFLEITVEDTGIGIKSENIEKLFRMEENFSTNGTANEKGSGLGLGLCHEFINRCGGTIRAESETGKGSRFIFTLPRNNLSVNTKNSM